MLREGCEDGEDEDEDEADPPQPESRCTMARVSRVRRNAFLVVLSSCVTTANADEDLLSVYAFDEWCRLLDLMLDIGGLRMVGNWMSA